MNLGFFMMPLHPPAKDRTQCFDEDLEFVERAEDLGFVEGWVGNHESLPWEPIAGNDIFLSAAFQRTKTIRLGPGVIIMPHNHPVKVASSIALLDHLSHGRMYFGFGQSGVPTDMELFNITDPKTQGLMTVECLDMVLKLWSTPPPYEFKGQFWTIKNQSVVPEFGNGELLKPLQKPHPPIGTSIVRAPSIGAKMAGARGYIPMSTNLVAPRIVKAHWESYADGAREAGQPEAKRSIWRVCRNVFIGESDDEAFDFAYNSALADSYIYLRSLFAGYKMLDLMKTDPGITDEQVDREYLVRNLCLLGTVDTVSQQLQDLYDNLGGFGTLLMTTNDWDDKAKWINSIERLAKEVIPAMPNPH